ncbi:hypothetical protein ABPG72_004015 [Tetrahymena utriculariae]
MNQQILEIRQTFPNLGGYQVQKNQNRINPRCSETQFSQQILQYYHHNIRIQGAVVSITSQQTNRIQTKQEQDSGHDRKKQIINYLQDIDIPYTIKGIKSLNLNITDLETEYQLARLDQQNQIDKINERIQTINNAIIQSLGKIDEV